MLEQAQLDFAALWLADVRSKLGGPVTARTRRGHAAATDKPRARAPVLATLPPADDEDAPKKDPRECSGCGGIINCSLTCGVGLHRTARQQKAAAGA